MGKYMMFNMNFMKDNQSICVKNVELLCLKKKVNIVTKG